jgi:ribose transport system ATP-binding protein
MDIQQSSIPLLKLRGISKSFPGVHALSNIDFDLESGEIHALLGENGAGKSTLMKILSGIFPSDAGEIYVAGKLVVLDGYEAAMQVGIGTVYQEFSLVPFLTAAENIFLGRELRTPFGILRRREMRELSAKLFERLNVHVDLEAELRHLSVAQQQFVEIAKALSINARILILDEPTSTLTPTEAQHLFAVMRDLKRTGVGIIFISHHLEEIFQICDRITVLRDGEHVATVPMKSTHINALVEMMVGRQIEQSFPAKPMRSGLGEVVLEVDRLQINRDDPEDSFVVRAGEILGFAGLVGSGRTEELMAVLGVTPAHHKVIKLDGKVIRLNDPADALAHGIGILPESRKAEGLITSFAILTNISLNRLSSLLRWGMFIDRGRERREASAAAARVGVKTSSIDLPVDSLSGGNQQKVVLARWLSHHIRVMLFDEPTRGIDVGAKAEIYRLIREVSASGCAVLVVSSELPEIVGLCDRVVVFRQGHIVATLEGDAITPETVMLHAVGGERTHV